MKYSDRRHHECTCVLSFGSEVNRREFSRQITLDVPNTKFLSNLPRRSRDVQCTWTDGRTDRKNDLIAGFCNFADIADTEMRCLYKYKYKYNHIPSTLMLYKLTL